MSKKYLIGLPVAVFALAPAVGAVAAPAQADTPTYTCNAQTWAGETLPTITVQAKKNKRQAQGVAQTTWGGIAKFSTIDCQLNK
ncbi:hypothetical protein D7D52_35560 [Nocardia yunnanensis]|uniref:Uncharacterized protein n=1 Tax=Nocardia yunnanensis TaxID=2382165 RepID=A0A386ZNK2_9NOCA|nr:hypothetical protein [Nocardia yunnanensis]AYF78269.1 hypothetical protein D7D52_35560 [Nocardia yunnanensis]